MLPLQGSVKADSILSLRLLATFFKSTRSDMRRWQCRNCASRFPYLHEICRQVRGESELRLTRNYSSLTSEWCGVPVCASDGVRCEYLLEMCQRCGASAQTSRSAFGDIAVVAPFPGLSIELPGRRTAERVIESRLDISKEQ